MPIKFVVML